MFKTLSVLVPVYNEKNTIEECLKKILSADTSGLELQIIVSDNNSTDGTREILSSFNNSKVKEYKYLDSKRAKKILFNV